MATDEAQGRAACPLCTAPLRHRAAASRAVFECPVGHVYDSGQLLRQLSRNTARRLKCLLDSLESSVTTSSEIERGAEELGKENLAHYLRRQTEEFRRLSLMVRAWFREEAGSGTG